MNCGATVCVIGCLDVSMQSLCIGGTGLPNTLPMMRPGYPDAIECIPGV